MLTAWPCESATQATSPAIVGAVIGQGPLWVRQISAKVSVCACARAMVFFHANVGCVGIVLSVQFERWASCFQVVQAFAGAAALANRGRASAGGQALAVPRLGREAFFGISRVTADEIRTLTVTAIVVEDQTIRGQRAKVTGAAKCVGEKHFDQSSRFTKYCEPNTQFGVITDVAQ